MIPIILAEKSDYDGGDPSLELVKRSDGLFDFVIYKGASNLTVHALSSRAVRQAALRILEVVPDAALAQSSTVRCPYCHIDVSETQCNEDNYRLCYDYVTRKYSLPKERT